MSVNKFYHIVLLGQVGTITSSQVSNCLFFFDWGQLPKSRWKVYITAGMPTTAYTTNQTGLINIDLGQSVDLAKAYNGKYSGTSQVDKNIYVSNYLNPANYGALNVFQIHSNSTNPIYLNSTPSNNTIIKTYRNNISSRPLFTPNTSTDIVILSMEQLDDPIPRSIKTSYQVVFNSTLGTMNGGFGSYSYFFDWSTIPQGEYLVNMSMISNGNIANPIIYSTCSVYIDLGQDDTVFFPSNQQNYNIRNKSFVGFCPLSGTNTLGQGGCPPLYSNHNTTKPLYISSRPTNNNVIVNILSDYKEQYAISLASIYNYTLILNFNLLG